MEKKGKKQGKKDEMEHGCGSGCGCASNDPGDDRNKMVAKDLETWKKENKKGGCGCC